MRKASYRRLISGLLIAATFAVAAPLTSVATSVTGAESWVAANRDALPRQYEQVAMLPVSYQKATMSALPADVAAGIWRTHLDRVLAEETLTAPQQAYIRKVQSLLVPALRSDPARLGELKQLCQEGARILGDDRQHYFQSLDRAKTGLAGYLKHPALAHVALGHSIRSTPLVRAVLDSIAPPLNAELDGCECSAGSWCTCDNCLFSKQCTWYQGCGCFWEYTCDGICMPD